MALRMVRYGAAGTEHPAADRSQSTDDGLLLAGYWTSPTAAQEEEDNPATYFARQERERQGDTDGDGWRGPNSPPDRPAPPVYRIYPQAPPPPPQQDEGLERNGQHLRVLCLDGGDSSVCDAVTPGYNGSAWHAGNLTVLVPPGGAAPMQMRIYYDADEGTCFSDRSRTSGEFD